MKTKAVNSTVTTVTFLNRQEIDYLDKLGKDYYFKYGKKLSRAKILAELVRLLMSLGIRFEEVNFENGDFHEAILSELKGERDTQLI